MPDDNGDLELRANPTDHQNPVEGVDEIDQEPAGTGAELSAVLDRARKQVGTAEDPPGSNSNKYTDWYGVDTPWCAIFVSWLFYRTDLDDLVEKEAWAPYQARWFQRKNRWGREARKGAMVYYDWRRPGSSGYNHVGIVEDVRSDDTFVTIEGNWRDAVRRVRRDMKYVKGFGYPGYDGTEPEPEPTTKVSLSAVVKAAKADPDRAQGGTTSGSVDDVKVVEKALKREALLDPDYAEDGSFGSLTVEAYGEWQRRCGYSGDDADGIPGEASLKMLGDCHLFRVID